MVSSVKSLDKSGFDGESRQYIHERTEYVAKGPTETFIVPLIRNEFRRVLLLWNETGGEKRVLDVGCGNQPFRKALESSGFQYESQDFHQLPNGQVDYVCSIEEPFPPELANHPRFTHVICTELLEHVRNWDQAFKNLLKSPKKGERFF